MISTRRSESCSLIRRVSSCIGSHQVCTAFAQCLEAVPSDLVADGMISTGRSESFSLIRQVTSCIGSHQACTVFAQCLEAVPSDLVADDMISTRRSESCSLIRRVSSCIGSHQVCTAFAQCLEAVPSDLVADDMISTWRSESCNYSHQAGKQLHRPTPSLHSVCAMPPSCPIRSSSWWYDLHREVRVMYSHQADNQRQGINTIIVVGWTHMHW